MPGKGRLALRDYTDAERAALEQEAEDLGLTLQRVLAVLGVVPT